MEITGVECIVLGTPPRERRAADQTHEVALIRITADDGSVGIGEAAVSPPVVKAFIDEPTSFSWSRGVSDILVGQDPVTRVASGTGSATAPCGRRASGSVGSPWPASTWRSGISRGRCSASRSGSCSARRRRSRCPVSHDVQGPSPLADDDPQSPTGSSTRPRPTGSARPRSRRSPTRPRTTTRSSSWRAR